MKKLLSSTAMLVLAACLVWTVASSGAALAQAPCNAAADQYDPNPSNNCDSATTVVFDPPGQGAGAAAQGASPGLFPFFPGFPPGVADTNANVVSPGVASTGTIPTGEVASVASGEASGGASAGDVLATEDETAATAPPPTAPAPETAAPSMPSSSSAGSDAAATAIAGSAATSLAASASSGQPSGQRMVLPDTGGSKTTAGSMILFLSAGFMAAAGVLARRAISSS